MIVFMVVLIVIVAALVGLCFYFNKKMAMFLPALLGLVSYKRIRERDYYGPDGKFRPATKKDKMAFFMGHPIFKGHKHMFFNVEDKPLKAISYSTHEHFQVAQGRLDQIDDSIGAFNYLVKAVENKKAWIIDHLYPQELIRENPYKSRLTGMFYQGDEGKPLAVVIPGGGFIANVTDCEGYPIAMKLHKLGYFVLVVNYPIGRQLGETEQGKQGQEAVRELVQIMKYLKEHERELHIDLGNYGMFGFSAGGMMTTAYSFANYGDCCHRYGLPRPRVIFPMYGLDWNIEALPQDKGLCVFSIADRRDEFGFGSVEDKLPALREMLGEENVSVRILDNLGHGFGMGSNTIVSGWFEEAMEFWVAHREG